MNVICMQDIIISKFFLAIQASGMRVVFDEDGNSCDPLELLASSGRLGNMARVSERWDCRFLAGLFTGAAITQILRQKNNSIIQ